MLLVIVASYCSVGFRVPCKSRKPLRQPLCTWTSEESNLVSWWTSRTSLPPESRGTLHKNAMLHKNAWHCSTIVVKAFNISIMKSNCLLACQLFDQKEQNAHWKNWNSSTGWKFNFQDISRVFLECFQTPENIFMLWNWTKLWKLDFASFFYNIPKIFSYYGRGPIFPVAP